MVRAQAGVALAKLAPTDEAIREIVLTGNCLVKAMCDVIMRNNQQPSGSISKPIYLAVEALSYLSIFIECKKSLATLENGDAIKAILSLVDKKDRSLNYGIAQILLNMSTSSEDLKRDYNAEIEQLRKMAAKGLKINQEKEVINNKAGNSKEISVIRKLIVDFGAVKSMYSASCTDGQQGTRTE